MGALMARKDARNVKPSLSNENRDKLLAALNHSIARGSPTYRSAPIYFDECRAWFERLSADDQETCRTLADVAGSAHKDAAEGMAASLPPAPQCPL
jgi:hypothetical protein